MIQRPDQDQVEYHIGTHADHGDLHWGLHVLAGKVARRQHLDQHEGHHPHRIGTQRVGRLNHVALGHGTIMKQRGNQWLGQQQQRQGCRHANQQYHAHGPVQGGGKGLGVFTGMLTGQGRQDHRPDSDTEGTQGQLGQPVGVVQPGDAASLQE